MPDHRAPTDSSAAATVSEVVSAYSFNQARYFSKYDALLIAVVGVTLVSGGIFEIFSHYREHRASLIRLQHEQAKAAAAKIGQFIEDIEGQLGWTTQLPWSASAPENRRFDALRLLRQAPAITELVMVDAAGKERLRVSRLSMDVIDSGNDLSQDPKFTEAIAHKVYFGPVYFRRESEPYMTVALAGTRKDAGVSIAEVNLKLIWDMVSQIKVGEHGHAYVVSGRGRLIAHQDMGLVLRNTDMSGLAQVQAAQAEGEVMSDGLEDAQDIQGEEVLTSFAPIRPLRWTMFVERPVWEAYASLYSALQRLAIALAAALAFATLAAMLLTRRLVSPFELLRAGAAHIGGGNVAQEFDQQFANGFSQDAGAGLVDPLHAPFRRGMASPEMIEIINRSASGLQAALDLLVQSAARLSSADRVLLDEKTGDDLQTLASYGFSEEFEAWRKNRPIALDAGSIIDRALREARPVQVLDTLADSAGAGLDVDKPECSRTMLAVPLMRDGKAAGVLILTRINPQLFDGKQIEAAAAFADLAAVLMSNGALLAELRSHAALLQPRDPASPTT